MSAYIFSVLAHIGAIQDPIMVAFEINKFFNLVYSLLECPHNFFHCRKFTAKFLELLDFSVCHCCEFSSERRMQYNISFFIEEKNESF